ncbi:MAG: GNAT family N-acetyltransferase [Thiohalomonadales bacterium]
MEIIIDDLSSKEIEYFLEQHITDMRATSPPESKHALELNELRKPEITFWSVYESGLLVGCGALKYLDELHGEIKSMRTSPGNRGKGIASTLLKHILNEAIDRGYNKVSLETGSMSFFIPARKLYLKFGFIVCLPFGKYKEDPNSVFMEKKL